MVLLAKWRGSLTTTGCPLVRQLSSVGNLQNGEPIGAAQSPGLRRHGLVEGLASMCVRVGVGQTVARATLGGLGMWSGVRDFG
jgi:hypothetical protein